MRGGVGHYGHYWALEYRRFALRLRGRAAGWAKPLICDWLHGQGQTQPLGFHTKPNSIKPPCQQWVRP